MDQNVSKNLTASQDRVQEYLWKYKNYLTPNKLKPQCLVSKQKLPGIQKDAGKYDSQ